MPEKGKVKWFSNVKGYGFLTKEGEEKDIFVHYASILSDGYKTLKTEEEVTFDIEEGAKGPQAKNVIRVAKPPKEKPAAETKAEEKAPAEEKPKQEPEKPAETPEKEKKKEEPKAEKEKPVDAEKPAEGKAEDGPAKKS